MSNQIALLDKKLVSRYILIIKKVFAISKEQLLYAYNIQQVQALKPRDFPNHLPIGNDWTKS